MLNILTVADKLGIPQAMIEPYGWDKAKIKNEYYEQIKKKPDGKLVLVTAITPTKAGEGKTTTTIGLHDGLRAIGVNSLACLREPSLGPCFGIKGGAVGALKSTIIPSDDINLHFTGDFHALTSTINLISAIIENHIYQGNELNINPNKIVWTRALDMNDRSLRSITCAQGDKKGIPHESEFVITVASELMAIMCIATDEEDFLKRVDNIIVAYDFDDNPIYLRQLKIRGAIKKLMHTALNPNLVQTLEENPVIIHGGPFCNIAHGCNSLIATRMALKLADIVVTEAGFGADLGAEKFFDIKCRQGNLKPAAVVLVATIRALKLHGGVDFEELDKENITAMLTGTANLKQHYDNVTKFGVPVIVAINRFPSDTNAEVLKLKEWCASNDISYALNTAALEGGIGAIPLAKKVAEIVEVDHGPIHYCYDLKQSIKTKIEIISKNIYHASSVIFSELALDQISKYEAMGYSDLPICLAKTPNSFSDNPKLLNVPTDFVITIREVRLSAGAGFIIPLAGNVMMMPGLPKEPLACKM